MLLTCTELGSSARAQPDSRQLWHHEAWSAWWPSAHVDSGLEMALPTGDEEYHYFSRGGLDATSSSL